MILKKFGLFSAALLLCSCSSKNEQKANQVNLEFDILCEKYTELVKLDEFETLDYEARALKLDSLLSKELGPSSNAYIAWTAIRNGPASERYFLFKAASASVGYKEWQCPAIEKYGHEIGS